MERCPVCRAKWKARTQCHRCKSDLSRLLQIEVQAAHDTALAIHTLQAGRPQQAQLLAAHALFLHATPFRRQLSAFILAYLSDQSPAVSDNGTAQPISLSTSRVTPLSGTTSGSIK